MEKQVSMRTIWTRRHGKKELKITKYRSCSYYKLAMWRKNKLEMACLRTFVSYNMYVPSGLMGSGFLSRKIKKW